MADPDNPHNQPAAIELADDSSPGTVRVFVAPRDLEFNAFELGELRVTVKDHERFLRLRLYVGDTLRDVVDVLVMPRRSRVEP